MSSPLTHPLLVPTMTGFILSIMLWSCSRPDDLSDRTSPQVSVTPLRDYSVSQESNQSTEDMATLEDSGPPVLSDHSMSELSDGMITDGMITDGMITDGVTPDVAVTPMMNLLDPYLPIPGCVAYFNDECMIYQAQSDQERCDQWVNALTPAPSLAPLSDLNECVLEMIPEPALQQAQEYLNVLRSWLQIPPVIIEQTTAQRRCALIARATNFTMQWNQRSQCYSEELSQALDGCESWISSGWTTLTMLEFTMSLSTLNLTEAALRRRHHYYDETLTHLSTGQYQNMSGLLLDFNSLSSTRRPFSLYPGVGTLPLELVSEGNQYRMPVSWSIALNQLVSGSLEYSVTQLAPTNQQLTVGRIDDFSDLKIFVFNLGQEVREGDIYRIDMSWRGESGPNTAQAYLTFKDCGYVIPNIDCQPLDQDPCAMPGLSCVPRGGQWLCSRRGSIGAYEDGCQGAAQCQDGLLCSNGACIPYCDPAPESWNTCSQLCPSGARDVRIHGVDLGLCLGD